MGLIFDSLFREAIAGPGVFDRVYGPWVTFNGSTNTPGSEQSEATVEPGTHKNPSGAERNLEPNFWFILPGVIELLDKILILTRS